MQAEKSGMQIPPYMGHACTPAGTTVGGDRETSVVDKEEPVEASEALSEACKTTGTPPRSLLIWVLGRLRRVASVTPLELS